MEDLTNPYAPRHVEPRPSVSRLTPPPYTVLSPNKFKDYVDGVRINCHKEYHYYFIAGHILNLYPTYTGKMLIERLSMVLHGNGLKAFNLVDSFSLHSENYARFSHHMGLALSIPVLSSQSLKVLMQGCACKVCQYIWMDSKERETRYAMSEELASQPDQ